MDLLDVKTPRFTRIAGAAGYAARGAVFIVIGWQVVSLAIGWGGRQLGMTVSGGVAAIRSTVRDAQQLLRNADAALYQAKRGGRNAVHAWFE